MRRILLVLTAIGVAVLLASGLAIAATILGTDGPDTLTGTSGDDTIEGFGGNDTISGMAGSDTIKGGLGADKLYGGNEYQSVGASADRDRLEGDEGQDTIVGGPGVDELKGGEGNDVIMEGPADDSAEEKFIGEDGDDFFSVASIPASKDDVQCGNGQDEVEADPLDVINNDCETVTLVTPEDNTEKEAGDEPGNVVVPEPENPGPETEGSSSGGITTQATTRRDNFLCNLPPRQRGLRWCESQHNVFDQARIRVGVFSAEGNCRDLDFFAYRMPNRVQFLGWGQIGDCFDSTDVIYAGGKRWTGDQTVAVYGRAAGTRWTKMSGYQQTTQ